MLPTYLVRQSLGPAPDLDQSVTSARLRGRSPPRVRATELWRVARNKWAGQVRREREPGHPGSGIGPGWTSCDRRGDPTGQGATSTFADRPRRVDSISPDHRPLDSKGPTRERPTWLPPGDRPDPPPSSGRGEDVRFHARSTPRTPQDSHQCRARSTWPKQAQKLLQAATEDLAGYAEACQTGGGATFAAGCGHSSSR